MQNSINEILRLVADRIILPEEGQSLLDALHKGYPEEFDGGPAAGFAESPTSERLANRHLTETVGPGGGDGMTAKGGEPTSGRLAVSISGGRAGAPADRSTCEVVLGAGVGSSDSDGSKDDADPWPSAIPHQPVPEVTSSAVGSQARNSSSRPLESAIRRGRPASSWPAPPHVTGEAPPDLLASRSGSHEPTITPIRPGGAVEIPPGVRLSIDMIRFPPSVADSLASIAIRGVPGQMIRVVRGVGAELRKDETAWQLSWSGGMLFLEIPESLVDLEMRGIPGSVGLSGYCGPFSGEEIGGGMTVRGASAPFRIRDVRGTVRLLRLALRDGISSIAAVTQDVEIETAREASVTIRASSRTASTDDSADRDARGQPDSDRGGRRGVWRVGAGKAQLNMSQIHGKLELHPADGAENCVP
jgi:hypothetical protein